MKPVWALQDAKNRLSEVVNSAVREGPQTITRRGKETAVVVSIEDFRQLTTSPGSLVSFFRNSPLAGSGVDLKRSTDYGREVDL
ncbi:MAG: type II toxin-antitoxin system Phd/YefM family antitoxin [Gemmatimonadota bacterium]|nr:type II toxin-antitoxin system Phd/YefM family antitoxin [Gemmatimonadota bacterium]